MQVNANVGKARRRKADRGATESVQLDRLQHLVTVVQELSLARALPAIQRVVRSAARHLMGADGATFVLSDHGKCYYSDEDSIAPLWKGRSFPMEHCVSGWSMLNRSRVVIEDIYRDARVKHDDYRSTYVKSLAVVPIRTLDPIGAIGVYWASQRAPGDAELNLLQALADSTAVAMENVMLLNDLEERVRQRTQALEAACEEIHHLALMDDLTGLRNRRGFFLLAKQQRKQAARNGNPAFIVFIDVDGLKQVNDTLGHEAGDQLLRNAARVLQMTFRESDIVARLGGDEFCVFAVEGQCDPSLVEQRLRRNIAAFNSNHSDSPFQLAVSIGVHPCEAGNRTPLERLVGRADEAMYAQKRCRNVSAV
jgi:diguanylate cyclase (GGDEF)-like protein